MNRHPKKMQAKARKIDVSETTIPGVYEVRSPSGNTYLASSTHCTCKWAEHHPDKICSHRMAVLSHVEEREAGP